MLVLIWLIELARDIYSKCQYNCADDADGVGICCQFSDQLEMMVEKLAAIAAQQQQLEPVSAHVDKLNAQLADNKAIVDDLDRNVSNIAALKTAADGLTRDAGPDDENSQGASMSLLYMNVSMSVNCHTVSITPLWR